MSSIVMCNCKNCGGIRQAVKTGMGAGAWIFNFIMLILTGFLFLPITILMVLVGSTTRCTTCGSTKVRKL